jgi:hypothetical protein
VFLRGQESIGMVIGACFTILSVYPWIGNTQSDSSPNKRMRDSDITRFSTIVFYNYIP